MVEIQGGDISYVENIKKFKKAEYEFEVISKKSGYVKNMKVANLGSFVEKGDLLAKIYVNDVQKGSEAIEQVKNCFEIVTEFVEKPKTILGVIR